MDVLDWDKNCEKRGRKIEKTISRCDRAELMQKIYSRIRILDRLSGVVKEEKRLSIPELSCRTMGARVVSV